MTTTKDEAKKMTRIELARFIRARGVHAMDLMHMSLEKRVEVVASMLDREQAFAKAREAARVAREAEDREREQILREDARLPRPIDYDLKARLEAFRETFAYQRMARHPYWGNPRVYWASKKVGGYDRFLNLVRRQQDFHMRVGLARVYPLI